jgi:hypothetical protein
MQVAAPVKLQAFSMGEHQVQITYALESEQRLGLDNGGVEALTIEVSTRDQPAVKVKQPTVTALAFCQSQTIRASHGAKHTASLQCRFTHWSPPETISYGSKLVVVPAQNELCARKGKSVDRGPELTVQLRYLVYPQDIGRTRPIDHVFSHPVVSRHASCSGAGSVGFRNDIHFFALCS